MSTQREKEINEYNTKTRNLIKRYAKKHKNIWMGKTNRYNKKQPYLTKYTGQLIYNFDYDFAIPCWNTEIIELLKHRETMRLEENYLSIIKIHRQIIKLKGIFLTWR